MSLFDDSTETEKSNLERFNLVELNPIIYRFYHSPKYGESLVQSVLNYVVATKTDMSRTIVFSDSNGGPTFRHQMSPKYKADRSGMDEYLKKCEADLIDLLNSVGIPVIVKDGYESEDALAMCLNYLAGKHPDVSFIIHTNDKDLNQLLRPGVNIMDSVRQTYVTPLYVEEKFGITPDKFVDYLALMGDKSDGVDGVDGVGPKLAAKWLNEYGTIEEVFANKDQISGRGAKALRESHLDIPFTKKLVTIVSDSDLLSFSEVEQINNPAEFIDEFVSSRLQKEYKLKLPKIEKLGYSQSEMSLKNETLSLF